jgi:hypothetical protein
MLRLANANAALKVVHDSAQLLDKPAFLGVDHRHQPLLIGLAADWPTRRQGRKWSCIAATQPAP